MSEKKRVKVTDVILRDAHQSLLATRMRTEDMLPVTGKLDKVGYWSLESWGGATFDSCIRFLNEDPWERIRRLKAAMPHTRMQMLLRGQNILGYRHYPDDVVEAFVERAAANGVDVFRIFDALNDVRNMETAIKATIKVGKHAQGAISYTISPVHTDEMYVNQAKELERLGCHSICIKDMAALLKPYQAYSLVSSLKKAVKIPIQLHCHATTGVSTATLVKAVEAGVDTVDTGISALSLGSAHTPTEALVAILQGTPWDTGFDLKLLSEIARYFKNVRKKYASYESSFVTVNTEIFASQVPGGMLSNLESQLRQQKALDKLDAVLEEIPKVRKDFGYPPLVTPSSQIVGTQAVFNVLAGERYKIITKESRALLKGEYGRTPAPANHEVQRLALGDEEPITHRPADDLEPELEKLKAELGNKAKSLEDVLTYALFPKVALKFFETRGKPIPVEEPERKEKPAVTKVAGMGGTRSYAITLAGHTYEVEVSPKGVVERKAVSIHPHLKEPKPVVKPEDEGDIKIEAPMAGTVIRIVAKVGDEVQEGDKVVIIEAMKMETAIRATRKGTIRSINVAVGDNVETGEKLATMS